MRRRAHPAAPARAPRPDPGTRSAHRQRGAAQIERGVRAPQELLERAQRGVHGSAARRVVDPTVASAFCCSSSASASVRRAAAVATAWASADAGEAEQQPSAQLVVIPLVGLDRVAVERRGLAIAHALAELDELPVLHHRDGLAGELPGRHALDGGRQRVEIAEERAPAPGQRIDRGRVDAQLAQALGDQPVVLGLVADLTGQRELDLDVVAGDQPAGGDLGGLDLVLSATFRRLGTLRGPWISGLSVASGSRPRRSTWLSASSLATNSSAVTPPLRHAAAPAAPA